MLVFTGGEPTLRRDLAEMIQVASAGGASVCLETNATLIDSTRAQALKDAGLTLARVNLAGIAPELDAITRDPGGLERTLDGVRALLDADVAVEISVTVVASTVSLLPALPAALHERFGGRVSKLLATVPVESPTASELLSYEDASLALVALDRAARKVGIFVRLRWESGPPPCVPEALGGRIAHLYTLTGGSGARQGYRSLEACAECLVADRCPGVAEAYLERWPTPPMKPIREDRQRRRLSRAEDVETQIERELSASSRRYLPGQGTIEDGIVRVHFHCNEACRFCFVSTHLPPPAPELVREAIRQAGERGARVSLSGGEPGLNPNLAEYVKLAAEVSEHPVELQTNAVPMAKGELARELADAGLSEALVSLHASTPELSEAITESPGSFARTVAGIDKLRAAGVRVTLNFVIHTANQTELPAFVRFVAARWPDAYLNVSFVHAASDIVPRTRELVPRYADVMPSLREAVADADTLGVRLTGFQSLCGLPLCLVPRTIRDRLELPELPPHAQDSEMTKSDVCGDCALSARCHGVRRGYVSLYGTDELHAVAADDVAAN